MMGLGTAYEKYSLFLSAEELEPVHTSDTKLTPVRFLISFQPCFHPVVLFNIFTANYVFMSYMTFEIQTLAKEYAVEINVGVIFLMFENHRQPCNLSPSFALRGTAVFLCPYISPHVEASHYTSYHKLFSTHTEVVFISALCCINYTSSASNRACFFFSLSLFSLF